MFFLFSFFSFLTLKYLSYLFIRFVYFKFLNNHLKKKKKKNPRSTMAIGNQNCWCQNNIPSPFPCVIQVQGLSSVGPKKPHLKLKFHDQAKDQALSVDTMASPSPRMCMWLSFSPRQVESQIIFVCYREKTQNFNLF